MKSNKHLFRVFLAVLPVLTQTGTWEGAFWGSSITAVLFFVSSIFFKLTRPLFPKIFFRFAVLLFPITALHGLFYWIEAPLIWSVSIFLLYDFKELESGARGTARVFWRALLFFVVICAIAGTRYFFFTKTSNRFFEHPAGILIALSMLWIFLKGKIPAFKSMETIR